MSKKSKVESRESDHHCTICMDDIQNVKKLECGHQFCKQCIDNWFAKSQRKCPSCGKLFGPLRGDQPPGSFSKRVRPEPLPGYPACKTIEITYSIPSGTQTTRHPHPGKPFGGTVRCAYLPDNEEGREVCDLLKQAFDAGLIFTVGRSITTGADNVVVWNDIHHKTSYVGPYGYPDPTYLARLKEELAAKGIVASRKTRSK